MTKALFALFFILIITACSDNNSTNAASAVNVNSENTICDYTFECNAEINVKGNVVYTKSDTLVFSKAFVAKAGNSDWAFSDLLRRINNSKDTLILKDTLLTESMISKIQHHFDFKLNLNDQIAFASNEQDLDVIAEDAYYRCSTDVSCKYLLTDPIDKLTDISNFWNLKSLINEGKSTCKLTNTECQKDQYVTD